MSITDGGNLAWWNNWRRR